VAGYNEIIRFQKLRILRTPLREKTNIGLKAEPTSDSMKNILFGQTSDQLNLIEKAKNVLRQHEQQNPSFRFC
jgi:hypothetical protein